MTRRSTTHSECRQHGSWSRLRHSECPECAAERRERQHTREREALEARITEIEDRLGEPPHVRDPSRWIDRSAIAEGVSDGDE